MGGLVAKSYLVDHDGGRRVIGVITLATLHHGTPPANDFATLQPFIAKGWGNKFQVSQATYWWKSKHSQTTPASNEANRSDLRWDDFDSSLGLKRLGKDENIWLIEANGKMPPYFVNLIAYAGHLAKSDVEWRVVFPNDHLQLEATNNIIYKAFNGRFGLTDGMVPFNSALFCNPNPVIGGNGTHFFCSSPVRVRRFEPGELGDVDRSALPRGTLSITRNGNRGYDHKDMYNRDDVLSKVVIDLCGFVGGCESLPSEPIPHPSPVRNVATIFLFDVSGSMNENNKIGQAREAGLDALRELRGSETAPPVSIMTFTGGCDPSSTRRHLGFTSNYTQAEGVMRGLPRPDGATPLPQAKDVGPRCSRISPPTPRQRKGRSFC